MHVTLQPKLSLFCCGTRVIMLIARDGVKVYELTKQKQTYKQKQKRTRPTARSAIATEQAWYISFGDISCGTQRLVLSGQDM